MWEIINTLTLCGSSGCKKGLDKDDLFGKAAQSVGSKTHMEYLLWTATVMAFSRH